MAARSGASFAELAKRVDGERDPTVPLASALRVAALGFAAAGHGATEGATATAEPDEAS